MKKNILCIYGSSTGNTEKLINAVKVNSIIKNHHINVVNSATIKDIFVIEKKWDLVILSSSTWGIMPPCLQEDFENFWKFLDKSSISANKFLIMGLGDKYYPHFAYAVDFLVENILKYNGIVIDYLKIQENWENNQKEIYYWINNLQF